MSAVVSKGALDFDDGGCTPNTDTTVRSCMRVLEIGNLPTRVTTGASGADEGPGLDRRLHGKYIYYPTLSVDSVGNVTIVYSLSSAADFPGIVTTQQAAGSPGVFTVVGPSKSEHRPTRAPAGATTAPRQRHLPRTVWVAGEWSTDVSGPAVAKWSTGIARIRQLRATPSPDQARHPGSR